MFGDVPFGVGLVCGRVVLVCTGVEACPECFPFGLGFVCGRVGLVCTGVEACPECFPLGAKLAVVDMLIMSVFVGVRTGNFDDVCICRCPYC